MTVTTPVNDFLAIARRYEAERRFAQAAAAYQEALDNMPHPTSGHLAGDRALIDGMRAMCVQRSHETTSSVATTATEEARWAIDRQGERAAIKRALATANNPKE
jgi:hypothetical protein